MTNTDLNLYQLLTEIFILLDDIDRSTLRAYNLSIPQFNALYHLNEHGEMSINDLSSRLICDKSNTTRLIDRLKKEGLVDRQRSKKDRRYVRISLTEAGAKVCQAAVIAHRASITTRMASLSTTKQKTLTVLLTDLRDGLREQIANN